MTSTPATPLPSAADLEPALLRALDTARSLGASGSEASLGVSRGLSVNVRMGEVDSVQFQRDRDLAVTVYFGHRTGSASTTDRREWRRRFPISTCITPGH
jgi:PmbA protein